MVLVRTSAVKELPTKTTIDNLNKVTGKPWAPTGDLTEKTVVPRANSDIVLKYDGEPLTFAPRSMCLTKAILKRFGHTASCSKCRALCSGDHAMTVSHSRECRERLEREA